MPEELRQPCDTTVPEGNRALVMGVNHTAFKTSLSRIPSEARLRFSFTGVPTRRYAFPPAVRKIRIMPSGLSSCASGLLCRVCYRRYRYKNINIPGKRFPAGDDPLDW